MGYCDNSTSKSTICSLFFLFFIQKTKNRKQNKEQSGPVGRVVAHGGTGGMHTATWRMP